MDELRKTEREWLAYMLWGERNGYTGVGSNRTYRKRDGDRLVARGFAEVRSLVVADGDGFTVEPERYRPAYCLTEQGRRVADALEADHE